MKRYLFIIVSVLLFALVLLNTDLSKVWAFVQSTDAKKLMVAFLLYIVSFMFRAYRWMYLLDFRDFKRLFGVVAIHTFSNNVYPARTGELSFFYLLRNHDKAELASALILARIMDVFSIGVFFSLSLIFVIGRFSLFTLMFLIVVCVPLAVFMVLKAASLLPEKGPLGKLRTFVNKVKDALKRQRAKLAETFLISLLVWGVKYLCFYFIALAVFETFSLGLNFFQLVFGVSFSELTTVLPVHSFGGYGTFEAGWAGGFMILGFSKTVSVTTGFLFHTILLLFSSILGLFFLFFEKFHEE